MGCMLKCSTCKIISKLARLIKIFAKRRKENKAPIAIASCNSFQNSNEFRENVGSTPCGGTEGAASEASP